MRSAYLTSFLGDVGEVPPLRKFDLRGVSTVVEPEASGAGPIRIAAHQQTGLGQSHTESSN